MLLDPIDPRLLQTAIARIFQPTPITLLRVAVGVSTYVYRLMCGDATFYLRMLPEDGASFAPEVAAMRALCVHGVKVPAIIHYEHYNAELQRSLLITTEIPGQPLSHIGRLDDALPILRAAGRDLAIINQTPVLGFGWIRRDQDDTINLRGEWPMQRAWALEHWETDLASLSSAILTPHDNARLQHIFTHYDAWLADDQAALAHGDLDVTHIYQRVGQYTGLIDFGEIRGANRLYDLGHVALHDGEHVPYAILPTLLEGYATVTPLPADSLTRIHFAALLIAIRALARGLQKTPPAINSHLHAALRRILANFADV